MSKEAPTLPPSGEDLQKLDHIPDAVLENLKEEEAKEQEAQRQESENKPDEQRDKENFEKRDMIVEEVMEMMGKIGEGENKTLRHTTEVSRYYQQELQNAQKGVAEFEHTPQFWRIAELEEGYLARTGTLFETMETDGQERMAKNEELGSAITESVAHALKEKNPEKAFHEAQEALKSVVALVEGMKVFLETQREQQQLILNTLEENASEAGMRERFMQVSYEMETSENAFGEYTRVSNKLFDGAYDDLNGSEAQKNSLLADLYEMEQKLDQLALLRAS